ncbi:MAG: hypothetical protein ACP5MC_01060 [Candidatus Micrarchaeia archaeon]
MPAEKTADDKTLQEVMELGGNVLTSPRTQIFLQLASNGEKEIEDIGLSFRD